MPPVGACINGLGALPSPYGPTLRGAHNALRASKNKKECVYEVNQINQRNNNGRKLLDLGVNMRLFVLHVYPSPTPPLLLGDWVSKIR